jgi:hypothetical protein
MGSPLIEAEQFWQATPCSVMGDRFSAAHRPLESSNKWRKGETLLPSLHMLLATPTIYLFFCLGCFIFSLRLPLSKPFSILFSHVSLLIPWLFCSVRTLISSMTDAHSSLFGFCLHLFTFSSRTSFSSYQEAVREVFGSSFVMNTGYSDRIFETFLRNFHSKTEENHKDTVAIPQSKFERRTSRIGASTAQSL